MNSDPWFKGSENFTSGGHALSFDIPHDVFSTLRIDEGTELLLNHLPESRPSRILDLGCGYGALGLPVAARFPEAQVDLVDRDLLAVKWAAHNAKKNGLPGVRVFGSLGYREVCSNLDPYDWVLCNVPARIGKPFIRAILEEGPGFEIRVVVIRDLIPVLHEISKEAHLGLREIALGPRHGVFAVSHTNIPAARSDSELYFRDRVEVKDGAGGSFLVDRPFDLGGDDPRRLRASLPLLVDTLPRQSVPKEVLCVRSGYGALPVLASRRWKTSRISAFDRDLLALEFTTRNDPEGRIRLLPAPTLQDLEGVFTPNDLFDLVTLEWSPSAGEAVARAELEWIRARMISGGQILVLALDKLVRDWKPSDGRLIASRDGFSVFELRA